ncbi:MAG: outer membrane beta-barrel protein, partial [Parvularculaceae bacterium]|nr:outer membrane beta-barrel protein [Parvularculaceae bacterium]
VDARARRAQYFENDGENATEYGLATDFRVDVGARSAVLLTADVKEGVEPRGSFETPSAASKPVRFMTRGAAAELIVAQTRTRQSLRASFERATFEDAVSNAGVVLPQGYRNANFYAVSGRFYRRINGAAELFAEARYSYAGYGRPQPFTLASQDSRGYSGAAGVAFDMNKVARGEVYAGYAKRDFESATLPDFQGFSAGAKVEWFLTPLTTVTATADRAVRDAAIPGATSYWLNAGSVTVEHELLRRVVLVAAAELRQADFKGLDRTDDERRFTVGADYAFRRNVLFGVRFNRLDMNSRGVAARPDFDSNSLRIGVSFRL